MEQNSLLQKLLDEKWPLHQDLSNVDRGTLEMFRQHFTEGYNARISEENTLSPGNPEYDLKKVLAECKKLISEDRPIGAILLYKQTMGTSLTEAKAILNL